MISCSPSKSSISTEISQLQSTPPTKTPEPTETLRPIPTITQTPYPSDTPTLSATTTTTHTLEPTSTPAPTKVWPIVYTTEELLDLTSKLLCAKEEKPCLYDIDRPGPEDRNLVHFDAVSTGNFWEVEVIDIEQETPVATITLLVDSST